MCYNKTFVLSMFTTVLLVMCLLTYHAGNCEDGTKDLYLMGLIPFGGNTWPAGEALQLAMDMALEQVNNRTDLLWGYRLNLMVEDTRVNIRCALD